MDATSIVIVALRGARNDSPFSDTRAWKLMQCDPPSHLRAMTKCLVGTSPRISSAPLWWEARACLFSSSSLLLFHFLSITRHHMDPPVLLRCHTRYYDAFVASA